MPNPITRPAAGEYPAYYEPYISKVSGNDLLPLLISSKQDFMAFLSAIPADKHNYRYADDKWSVKEVLGHLIDAERIFAYRALRFARKDNTPLAGFEENDYVPESNAANRTMQDMLEEYNVVRDASVALFKSLTGEMVHRTGIANQQPITVRAIGYILVGHQLHHQGILKERYLV